MVSLKSRSYLSILLHVFSWMLFAFVLLFHQPLSWNITLPPQFWVKQGCILVMLIAVFYVNSKILVPQLLLKKQNTHLCIGYSGHSHFSRPLRKDHR